MNRRTLAAALAGACSLRAAGDTLITIRNEDGWDVTLENKRFRARYGKYMSSDVGPKDAMVELILKPGTENLAARIDSRSANGSKLKANRLNKVTLLRDDPERKTVRLDYGDGSAVQDVTIYSGEPWLKIAYLHHDVNIFDTGAHKSTYEIFGAHKWQTARKWPQKYPPYPESYYRKEWGAPGPLEYRGHFIMGCYDQAGHGYGRVVEKGGDEILARGKALAQRIL